MYSTRWGAFPRPGPLLREMWQFQPLSRPIFSEKTLGKVNIFLFSYDKTR